MTCASPDNARFCSAISDETRRKIIELIIARRTKRSVARLLGVSPPAVSKYASGAALPSAKTLCRIMELICDPIENGLDEYTALRIKELVLDDLLASLRDFVMFIVQARLLDREDVRKLQDFFSALILSTAGAESHIIRVSTH